MSAEIVNIGINHPAYKVGKRELLEWMNSVLNSSISNVDKDVGDGAAYAQVFHAINKSSVAMSQVKFRAKSEYEYTINYNIVQKAMKKLKIDKIIPCEALMKGKPLDNIEFCQWLKHFYSNVGVVEDYDGYEERSKVDAGLEKAVKRWHPNSGEPAPRTTASKSAAPKAAAKKPMAANQARPASRAAPASGASSAELKELQEENAAQKEEISELTLNVDALTKERDFYFGKLRDVEIMIQEGESEEGIGEDVVAAYEAIKAILYATDDAPEEEEDF